MKLLVRNDLTRLLGRYMTGVVFVGLLQVGAAQFTCDPTTDCAAAEIGDPVPDPDDCNSYYFCLATGPTSASIACEADMYFEVDTAECINGTCTEACSVAPTGNSGCTTSCTENYDILPYPGDCQKYYICLPSGMTEVSCATDEYFDGTACTADESSCCVYCEATCLAEWTQVADPEDCTKFYVCDADSAPTISGQCDTGMYFDISTASCVTGSTCTSYCSGTDTSTDDPTDGISTCITTFTCPSAGSYAACTACDAQYFNCADAGGNGVPSTCSDGYLFDPTVEFCVLEDLCPYF